MHISFALLFSDEAPSVLRGETLGDACTTPMREGDAVPRRGDLRVAFFGSSAGDGELLSRARFFPRFLASKSANDCFA